MSGLTAFLQTELLSLSSEARRKHPEIKEAAERLSAILRSFKERPGHSIANELSKSEDALRPFVLACETKQVKLVTIAIGCIQKLISFHAIPETSVRTILRTLVDISVHGVEIQLKILQTVLPLLTNYRSVHDDILAEALLICFRLQDSKIVVVNNTAAATLRQLVIFVFDKVAKEDAAQLSKEEAKHEVQLSRDETILLHPCAKDAFYLFQDLCLLTSGEPAEYLRLGHLSKTFGLELIESVLTNHYTLFPEHKELIFLLRERVCPLILKIFSEKHEFPQTMRLTRVVYILIKQFNEILITECEIFLSMFVKVLEPENPLWQRVLAMEIFRGVCGDCHLLCSIYKWYDRQNNFTNVFRDMITAFGRLASEKPHLIGASQGAWDSVDHSGSTTPHAYNHPSASSPGQNEHCISANSSTMRIQCIDQLDKADPPTIPETYIFYLALLCLNSIADGLAGYALPRFSHGNGRSTSTTTSKTQRSATLDSKAKDESATEEVTIKDDLQLITDMANDAWPGLLAAMSFYLSTNIDEELFQSTMRSYQNFTNVCGMLNLVVPRDAFLTNLCKNAIPASSVFSAAGFFGGKSGASSSSLSSMAVAAPVAIAYTDLPVQQQQILANMTLSDKNLYSLRILLNIAMFLGSVLGPSWYLVLETLQQADLLLLSRLTPKGGVSTPNNTTPNLRRTLTSSQSNSGTNPALSPGNPTTTSTTQMMDADHIAVIQTSMNRLFENSKYLNEQAFIDFATALCRLSAEFTGVNFHDTDASSSLTKSFKAKIFNHKSFAIDKLRHIVMLDINRLINPQSDAAVWDLIMSHLIATANCATTPSPIRTQCCQAISDIILTAMDHVLSEYKEADERIQTRLLTALNQCINNSTGSESRRPSQVAGSDKWGTGKSFTEVQKMALETLNNLLQTSGHSFTCGWGLIFDMLRHATTTSISLQNDYANNEDELEGKNGDEDGKSGERASIDTTTSSLMAASTAGHSLSGHSIKASAGLIKVAFASLQLICTDFLSLLSPDCLRQCIATLGSFGMQSEDLNISLTAVGLLWNLADFIQTQRLEVVKNAESELMSGETAKGEDEIAKEDMNVDQPIENEQSRKVYNILWMILLLQLSHTCTDWRPEVRNGANQTLFRTIMMNGNMLSEELWNACLWQVLFPLLDAVKMSSIRASRMMLSARSAGSSPPMERDSSGFMLHHSRDTAEKQWDETKVLVLTGMAGIFNDFLSQLYRLPRFEQAWSLLLVHLEDSCLQSSQEVALASIKSFRSIVTLSPEFEIDEKITKLWRQALGSWETIGGGIMSSKLSEKELQEIQARRRPVDLELHSLTLSLSSSTISPISEDFTQDTLTAYVNMFIALHRVIAPTFNLEDLGSLLGVLRNVMVYPTSPQYRPDIDNLSPLQEAILEVFQVLDMQNPGVAPLVLMDLSEYMTLAFLSPQDDPQKSKAYIPPNQRKFSTVTYIALNKRCSTIVAELFKSHVDNPVLYSDGVFERIIGSYGLPMKLKYDCPPSYKHGDDKTPLWKMATTGLLDVLSVGLKVMQSLGEDVPLERFSGVWWTLVDIFEGSLLSPSAPPTTLSIEELDIDEQFDIMTLNIIQKDIMVYMGEARVPKEVIKKMVHVIKESSRLYYVDDSDAHRKAETEAEDERPTKQLAIESGTKAQGIQERTSELVGTTGTIVPVMKEAFAYAAFKSLFGLCSADHTDFPQVRHRIAQITIPVLLDRCETILRNYAADEPLMGRCPFPRYLMGVRKEEMLFFLKQSIQLRLKEDIMEFHEDVKDTAKYQLLSGPKAHLFYLYPALCHMITCGDPIIVTLIQECLQVAGAEIGLGSRHSPLATQ
ncbi:uncharacterized protein BYT42DRAFT_573702 [Radiomyces spectabilis]|uniref:uncharacterized protein n=1 Tax=Radiomyces spectabilis TaxID=64574 RepID=UPI00221F69E8|nr:uncharacterized protein BYT42DRAFT_573702 [Radiomyces spectabilis]KAI8376178.1 hypothetical protein BYT42DRAFT_573702 [Radiomyces spectabilis]